jgi:hypothetical protein
MNSYCDLTTEIIIRLHGLQMDYVTVLATMFGSLGFFLSLGLFVWLPMRTQYNGYSRQINNLLAHDNEFGEASVSDRMGSVSHRYARDSGVVDDSNMSEDEYSSDFDSMVRPNRNNNDD